MKKTVKINISGLVFNIDEDAFEKLRGYLDKLESRFRGTPGEGEIMADIESRIAEIFQSRISDDKHVVNLGDVEAAIGILGEPEDISGSEDDESIYDEEPRSRTYHSSGRRRLYRDPDSQVIGGVCGGVGEYFGVDPVIIRIIFVVFFLLWGAGFLVYILLWIVLPEARTTAEKLEMKGERINVENIERSIRREYDSVKENLKNIPETEAYKRTRRGVSGVGRTLGQIIVTFLKVIGIIIGGAFVIAGIVLLVGILGGLVAGQTWLMGDIFSWQEFSAPQILGLFVDESVALLALICIVVVIAIPILGLIYGGVKLLFPFRAHDRAIGFSSFGIWIVAIVLLAVFALSEGVKYNDYERVIEDVELKLPSDKVYFMVATSSYEKSEVVEMDFGYHRDLQIVEEGKNLKILGLPVVDVVKTSDTFPSMTLRKESRGVNESAAERFAEQIEFSYTVRDSFLIIDPYFEMGDENKWRGQELEVVINLPVGYRIFLDESSRDFLSGIRNTQGKWSRNMVGKEWLMSEEGLQSLSIEED
jgi:phage shock protein PspC (stress-responsive transcriptional regulator)